MGGSPGFSVFCGTTGKNRHSPTPRRADNRLGLVFVELGLGHPDRLGEVLVVKFRVDDRVAVVL
jgi:hypothetical protein